METTINRETFTDPYDALDRVKRKMTKSMSYSSRSAFDSLASRYNLNIRKYGTDEAGSGAIKEQIGVDILQVQSLVADLSRDIVTFNWDFAEKVFTFKHMQDEEKVLDVLASKIQKAINNDTSGFAVAHSKVVTDWIELGWGVLVMRMKNKRLFFDSLSPMHINYNYDAYGELTEVFYNRAYSLGTARREETFYWHKLSEESNNKWTCHSFLSVDNVVEHTEKQFKYQPIYIIRDAQFSEQVVPIGRGLNLYPLIAKTNNVYMTILDTAGHKINKAIIMDKNAYNSLDLQVDTSGEFPFGLPIISMENSPNGLNMGISGSMQVLDNGADPSLSQWFVSIGREAVAGALSINRLLVKKEKTEMTATEVNIRHTEDKRIIDLATKSFKTELLSPLIFTLFDYYKEQVDEASTEMRVDYEIVWNDRSTKSEIDSRLQEIMTTVQVLDSVLMLGQKYKLNTDDLIKEISAKTKFTAITGYNKSESVTSSLTDAISSLRERGQQ